MIGNQPVTCCAIVIKSNGQAKHLRLALTELRAQQGRDHLAICLVVALSRLTGLAYVLISLHHHDQSLKDTLCQLGVLVAVTRHPMTTTYYLHAFLNVNCHLFTGGLSAN